MGRTASIDNSSIQKTANATEQLVKLNIETSKQTKWVILLTVIIAILTLIMAVPIIMAMWKYIS